MWLDASLWEESSNWRRREKKLLSIDNSSKKFEYCGKKKLNFSHFFILQLLQLQRALQDNSFAEMENASIIRLSVISNLIALMLLMKNIAVSFVTMIV